jgi:hypothetical protein
MNQKKNQRALTVRGLRAWYRRYGFVTYRRYRSKDDYGRPNAYDVMMRREPEEKKRRGQDPGSRKTPKLDKDLMGLKGE